MSDEALPHGPSRAAELVAPRDRFEKGLGGVLDQVGASRSTLLVAEGAGT